VTDAYMEGVYETFFQMKYFGGWSYIEAYNLPIPIRQWFYSRLKLQKENEQEEVEKSRNQNK
jgi:hypothetical protein